MLKPIFYKSRVHIQVITTKRTLSHHCHKLLLIVAPYNRVFTFGFFALALAANNILFIDFGLTVGFLTFCRRTIKIIP